MSEASSEQAQAFELDAAAEAAQSDVARTDQPPQPTGDHEADAVLRRLWELDRSDTDDELAAFRDALDELRRLTDDQPRLPGGS